MIDVTCREVITFLLEYLSDELAPEKAIEFEEHLSVCPSCVAYLRSYRETIRLARASMQSAPLHMAESEAIIQAILLAVGREKS